MTTIAWDGKTLAADRRIDFDGVSDVETTKILKRRDGALCGTSGAVSLGAAFKRWFLKGEKGERPVLSANGERANGLIIRPNGQLVVHDINGWYEAQAKFYANGSGWELAMGAMHAGATAEQAVAIAAKLDGRTGGDIDTLELGPCK